MKKEISNIDEIIKSITDSDLFELRFNKDYPELTESINGISFGKDIRRIYLTITNFGQTMRPDPFGRLKIFNYNLNLDNLDNVISNGMELILCDRAGSILYNFEFTNCTLHDIAEQRLDYNLNHKFKTYILSIGYYNIFKILEK